MQKQIGLGWNGRLTPPEDFSRKATHCVCDERVLTNTNDLALFVKTLALLP